MSVLGPKIGFYFDCIHSSSNHSFNQKAIVSISATGGSVIRIRMLLLVLVQLLLLLLLPFKAKSWGKIRWSVWRMNLKIISGSNRKRIIFFFWIFFFFVLHIRIGWISILNACCYETLWDVFITPAEIKCMPCAETNIREWCYQKKKKNKDPRITSHHWYGF